MKERKVEKSCESWEEESFGGKPSGGRLCVITEENKVFFEETLCFFIPLEFISNSHNRAVLILRWDMQPPLV